MINTTAAEVFTHYDSSQWLDHILRVIGDESPAEMLQREKSAFDLIASPCQDSLVLFGCGYLGRYVLKGLRDAGIEPVAFADNNPRRWGTQLDGLEVISPADAVARFNQSACFVVTVYNGSAVTEQLRAMKCNRVSPVAPLYWKYPDVFIPSSCFALPHSIMEQAGDIRSAYAVLSDDASGSAR